MAQANAESVLQCPYGDAAAFVVHPIPSQRVPLLSLVPRPRPVRLMFHPPREFLDKWARENPRQAVVFVLFGVAMIGLVIWIAVSDWIHGIP
jgi:hypothetical protein